MTINSKFKFGKKPRGHMPVPHFSALLAGKKNLPVPPETCDNTKGITEFGIMLNDTLGDCTCAGIYHAQQIWSGFTGKMETDSDKCVLDLYENACGYKPGHPNTDNGGILQDVLTYCVNTGYLTNSGDREKLLAFVEVDNRNKNDVKLAINEFGLGYIGFTVPNTIFGEDGNPLPVWDFDGHSIPETEGGHCVILVGYDDEYLTVLSWGELYKMTWSFLNFFCDEIYAIVSQDWLDSNGQSPLGLTTEQLEALMSGIKK